MTGRVHVGVEGGCRPSRCMCESCRPDSNPTMYTKQDCIDSLKEAKAILGHSPGAMEYRELDLSPSSRTIVKKFGSWNEAKEKAELETTDRVENLVGEPNRRYRMSVPPGHYWDDGYEFCSTQYQGTRYRIRIHRLLAVAEYGIDEVKGKDVHHKNGIPWDNRVDNIEVLTPSEHMRLHGEENSRRRDVDGRFV